MLIRLLNVSESVFDEGFDVNIDSIRQSFIFKIVQKFDPKYEIEDHINSQNILAELVDFKVVYTELTSPRCIELYTSYLSSDSTSAKSNLYMLLTAIIGKYNSNESY